MQPATSDRFDARGALGDIREDALQDLLDRYESEDERLYCSDEIEDFVRYLDRSVP